MKIDPEFRDLIIPLSDNEKGQLEENIKRDGCLDALKLWQGLLIDGHHRYEICERLGIEYQTTTVELDSREDALDWIDRNQAGRRNLSPMQLSLVRGRIYNRAKQIVGANQHTSSLPQSEGASKGETAERLAPQFGVSRATLERDGAFAASVEKLKPVAPELSADIAKGTAPTRQTVKEAAKLVDEQPEAAAELLKPKPHVSHNSGENEWYTPKEYIDAARLAMGSIDLDPASCERANEVVGATEIYTEADDGPEKPWHGNVWINPPYSAALVKRFSASIVSKVDGGEVDQLICLVNNATETTWGQSLLVECSAVCFPKGRVRFWSPGGAKGAPLQGQMILYFGDRVESFCDAFADLGVVKK